MKNNLLLFTILFACASVVGVEGGTDVDPDVHTVHCSDISGSTASVSLPDCKQVLVNISDISGGTVNVFIHPSNKVIHFNVHDLSGSKVYLYGTTTPQIKSHMSDISGSNVDLEKIMHPARQYTYHAVAGVVVLGLLHQFSK